MRVLAFNDTIDPNVEFAKCGDVIVYPADGRIAFFCNFCEIIFPVTQQFSSHMKTQHPEKLPMSKNMPTMDIYSVEELFNMREGNNSLQKIAESELQTQGRDLCRRPQQIATVKKLPKPGLTQNNEQKSNAQVQLPLGKPAVSDKSMPGMNTTENKKENCGTNLLENVLMAFESGNIDLDHELLDMLTEDDSPNEEEDTTILSKDVPNANNKQALPSEVTKLAQVLKEPNVTKSVAGRELPQKDKHTIIHGKNIAGNTQKTPFQAVQSKPALVSAFNKQQKQNEQENKPQRNIKSKKWRLNNFVKRQANQTNQSKKPTLQKLGQTKDLVKMQPKQSKLLPPKSKPTSNCINISDVDMDDASSDSISSLSTSISSIFKGSQSSIYSAGGFNEPLSLSVKKKWTSDMMQENKPLVQLKSSAAKPSSRPLNPKAKEIKRLQTPKRIKSFDDSDIKRKSLQPARILERRKTIHDSVTDPQDMNLDSPVRSLKPFLKINFTEKDLAKKKKEQMSKETRKEEVVKIQQEQLAAKKEAEKSKEQTTNDRSEPIVLKEENSEEQLNIEEILGGNPELADLLKEMKEEDCFDKNNVEPKVEVPDSITEEREHINAADQNKKIKLSNYLREKNGFEVYKVQLLKDLALAEKVGLKSMKLIIIKATQLNADAQKQELQKATGFAGVLKNSYAELSNLQNNFDRWFAENAKSFSLALNIELQPVELKKLLNLISESYFMHREEVQQIYGNLFDFLLKGRSFFCCFCPRLDVSHTLMLQHHKVHSNLKPFYCIACGRAFVTTFGYMSHQNKHEPLDISLLMKQEEVIDMANELDNMNNNADLKCETVQRAPQNAASKYAATNDTATSTFTVNLPITDEKNKPLQATDALVQAQANNNNAVTNSNSTNATTSYIKTQSTIKAQSQLENVQSKRSVRKQSQCALYGIKKCQVNVKRLKQASIINFTTQSSKSQPPFVTHRSRSRMRRHMNSPSLSPGTYSPGPKSYKMKLSRSKATSNSNTVTNESCRNSLAAKRKRSVSELRPEPQVRRLRRQSVYVPRDFCEDGTTHNKCN